MYHHFKGDKLSRSEKIQRLVVEMIIHSKLPDDKRESSIVWECKHSSSCIQVGRILAEKRGLNKEYAEIICALHDISVIKTGTYENHALESAKLAKEILNQTKDFTDDEVKLFTDSIAHHSEKQIYTDDPYIEFAKDADALDCSLYESVISYYRQEKPPNVYKEYINRFNRLRDELGLPCEFVT